MTTTKTNEIIVSLIKLGCVIEIIDTHPGQKCNDGGEYGEYRRLIPIFSTDGKRGLSHYEVVHLNTGAGEFGICRMCGQLSPNDDCCEEYQQLSVDKVLEMLSGFESVSINEMGISADSGHDPYHRA